MYEYRVSFLLMLLLFLRVFPLVLDLIFLVAYIHKINISLFISMSQDGVCVGCISQFTENMSINVLRLSANLVESVICGYMLCYVSRPNKMLISSFPFTFSRFIFKSSAIVHYLVKQLVSS